MGPFVKVQIRMSIVSSIECMYILILCSCYGQLRFSLYSGAVITRIELVVTIPLLVIVS